MYLLSKLHKRPSDFFYIFNIKFINLNMLTRAKLSIGREQTREIGFAV